MTDIERLTAFIRLAKQQQSQMSDEFLATLLKQEGWSEQRIYQAFAAYYRQVLGQAIPSRGRAIEGAREAFLYLLAFIALGFWVVGFILLADQLINHFFPSPLAPSSYSRSEVAGQLATLIVAFPLFLVMNWLIVKEVERRPEALQSGIRKWLTYIALVITAITLLADAVAVIGSFLSGDLTVRFALQAAILFAVSGGVFWYYLGTMRPEGMSMTRNRGFGLTAAVAVLLIIVVGFAEAGSPARQRSLAMDSRRVAQLSKIANAIHDQTAPSSNAVLPKTLGQLSGLRSEDINDPLTHIPFDYFPQTNGNYRLCATFANQSDSTIPVFWAHAAGARCYLLDARRPVNSIYYYYPYVN